jgi:hypothetical protein
VRAVPGVAECDACLVADRGEAIFWGGFMVGLAIGLSVSVFLVATGWLTKA